MYISIVCIFVGTGDWSLYVVILSKREKYRAHSQRVSAYQ